MKFRLTIILFIIIRLLTTFWTEIVLYVTTTQKKKLLKLFVYVLNTAFLRIKYIFDLVVYDIFVFTKTNFFIQISDNCCIFCKIGKICKIIIAKANIVLLLLSQEFVQKIGY